MKKFVFMLLCATMFVLLNSSEVCAQEKNEKIKIAATSNFSDAPANEGIKKALDFLNGNTTYALDANSPKRVRKAAVKMARELYVAEKISYEQYADVCRHLNFKPKPRTRF
jgi:hypothetical protein